MNAKRICEAAYRLPDRGGNPIAGTYGINLQQGDGNTFTGGDVEGCATGAAPGGECTEQHNRRAAETENSTNQVVADTGSAYNN